jgi:hypothetical protein
MDTADKKQNSNQLLVNIFTEKLGFDRLSAIFPYNIQSIYIYAFVFIFIDFGVVNTYFHVFKTRPHGFIQNPYSLAIPAAIITATVGIQYMSTNIRQALEQMNIWERADYSENIQHTRFSVSLRSKIILYAIIISFYYIYIFIVIGLPSYLETFGVVSTIAFVGVIYPLGYVPIAIEFFMLFVSIHIVIPKEMIKVCPTPAFLDPRNLGGFYPIGELLKRSYYIYTVGLLLFLSYIYGPTVTEIGTAGISRSGTPEVGFFTILWVFGIIAVGFSMFTIHRLMAKEKESQLSQLEEERNNLVDNPYDISSAELHDNTEIEQIQRRIEQVRAMRVYPTTLSTTTHLLGSVLLPQIMNLILQSIN